MSKIKLMTTSEAAKYLKVSRSFLDKDRCYEKNIPFLRIGRKILYDKNDLNNYIKSEKDIVTNNLINTKEAAECLNVSEQFLLKDRCNKKRIPFLKVGRKIFYDKEQLQKFIEDQKNK